jgi:hypothetical protein
MLCILEFCMYKLFTFEYLLYKLCMSESFISFEFFSVV